MQACTCTYMYNVNTNLCPPYMYTFRGMCSGKKWLLSCGMCWIQSRDLIGNYMHHELTLYFSSYAGKPVARDRETVGHTVVQTIIKLMTGIPSSNSIWFLTEMFEGLPIVRGRLQVERIKYSQAILTEGVPCSTGLGCHQQVPGLQERQHMESQLGGRDREMS